ncbi:A/G-specific adenine glycosylase [Dinghuibacter silviterrae]|uniref:Adenine DNA glycosylase n=1 Tax=Dinghuibacter silviterrae TaxID=1539049 RepID=A0A4R8DQC7_9BACT|nr:A/G-specific adenine glycosylase [Dinghuibacter silviterrae]TDW99506.1 A/G-specific DNA-adenine glycosylase [Dinghuibacter silviterrae]
MQTRFFTQKLLEWNAGENTRQMPWKGEKDPYKIWLSEVILQQTRVEQGLAYYERFVDAFPRVADLAAAQDDRVFKLWEGLGYYSRCKNLLQTARYIAGELQGRFPDTYQDILGLKGVGSYTASAIASFAFGLPHAVVDGNVLRVLSRFFGIDTPIDTTEGRSVLTALADQCLDKDDPAAYNQALMDFGAVVCKPVRPACDTCPFKSRCVALKQEKVDLLPIKSKRLVRKDRFFLYLVAEYNNGVYIRKRTGKDIWQQLFEFIGHEVPADEDGEDYGRQLKKRWFTALFGKDGFTVLGASPVYRQLLTHQQVKARFVRIHLERPLADGEYIWVDRKELATYPFPRLLNDYLNAPIQAGQLF